MELTPSKNKKHVAVSGNGIEKEKTIFLATAWNNFYPIVYVGPPNKIPASIFLEDYIVVGKPMERFAFIPPLRDKSAKEIGWEINREDALKQLENAGITTRPTDLSI